MFCRKVGIEEDACEFGSDIVSLRYFLSAFTDAFVPSAFLLVHDYGASLRNSLTRVFTPYLPAIHTYFSSLLSRSTGARLVSASRDLTRLDT